MSLNSHLFFMHIPSVSWIYYKQNQLAVREKNHIIKPFFTALFSPLSSKFEITLACPWTWSLGSNVNSIHTAVWFQMFIKCHRRGDWPVMIQPRRPVIGQLPEALLCVFVWINQLAHTEVNECVRPLKHTHLHTLCGQDSSVDITIVWGPWGRIRVRKSCLTDLLVHIVCENNGRHGRPIVWVKARQKALNHRPLY